MSDESACHNPICAQLFKSLGDEATRTKEGQHQQQIEMMEYKTIMKQVQKDVSSMSSKLDALISLRVEANHASGQVEKLDNRAWILITGVLMLLLSVGINLVISKI